MIKNKSLSILLPIMLLASCSVPAYGMLFGRGLARFVQNSCKRFGQMSGRKQIGIGVGTVGSAVASHLNMWEVTDELKNDRNFVKYDVNDKHFVKYGVREDPDIDIEKLRKTLCNNWRSSGISWVNGKGFQITRRMNLLEKTAEFINYSRGITPIHKTYSCKTIKEVGPMRNAYNKLASFWKNQS